MNHNIGYEWRDVLCGEQFAIQRNGIDELRVVRIIRPANADGMSALETIAEGIAFVELQQLLRHAG